jgi:uridine phosphorylase
MCNYTEEEKMDFLDLAHKRGVRNIEMESLAFGAFTSTIKVKSACVAVTLLNRLEGDSVKSSPETLGEYERRVTQLILEFVQKDFEVRLGWDQTLSAD